MSFFKKLFGGDTAAPVVAAQKTQDYKGFTIRPTPFQEGGQYQTCGIISKDVDGVVKEHKLIRADRFPSLDDATETTVRKARQVIDEQGNRIFG